MQKLKKMLAMLLCFTMILSSMPMTTFAASGATSSQATMSLEIIKEDSSKSLGYDLMTDEEVEALTKDSTFLVGIKMENMERMPGMTTYHSENGLDESDDALGLFSMWLGIEYNTTYLQFEPNSRGTSGSIISNTYSANEINRLSKNANSYITVCGDGYNPAEVGDSRNSEIPGWKVATIKMMVNNEDAAPQYRGGTTEYFSILEFKVIDTPPAAGGDVLRFYTGDEADVTTSIDFGLGGEGGHYQWNADGEEWEMSTYLYLDSTGADIFPKSYDVVYDMNVDSSDLATSGLNPTSYADGSWKNTKVLDGIADKVPTRTDGKVFTGWNTKNDGSGVAVGSTTTLDATTMLNTDGDSDGDNDTVTLYAQWQNGYGLTFDANGGTFADGKNSLTVVAATGSALTTTAALPTKKSADGTKSYVLKGWQDAANGTTYDISTYATLQAVADKYTTTGKVVAMWDIDPAESANAVAVTFNYNDGATADKVVNIYLGDSLGTDFPADPTRTLYTFNTTNSWNTKQNGMNGDVLKDKDTKVVADTATPGTGEAAIAKAVTGGTTGYEVTVYAQWTADNSDSTTDYTVKFYTDEAKTDEYLKLNVPTGESVMDLMGAAPDDPTKTGSAFDYWYLSTDASKAKYELNTAVTGDIDLLAKWTDKLTVEFNANGGDFAPGAKTKLEDLLPTYQFQASDFPTVTPATAYAGKYEFKSWNTKADASGTEVKAGDTVTADMATLYAIYGPDSSQTSVTVTFDGNGADAGKGAKPETVSLVKGDKIDGSPVAMPADPERDGYKFEGWFTASVGGTQFTDQTVVSEDMTVYAQWTSTKPVGDYYVVNFHDNDGSNNVATVHVNKNDSPANLKLSGYPAVPTRAGYTALRWENDAKDLKVGAVLNGQIDWASGTTSTDTDPFKSIDVSGKVDGNNTLDLYLVWGIQPTITLAAGETSKEYSAAAVTELDIDKIESGATATDLTTELKSKAQFTFTKGTPAVAATPKDVANDYHYEISFPGEASDKHPVEVGTISYASGQDFAITAKALTFKLATGAAQEVSTNTPTIGYELAFEIDGTFTGDLATEIAGLTVGADYYETTGATLGSATTGKQTAYGTYAVQPTVNSTNYTFGGFAANVTTFDGASLPGVTNNDDLKMYAKFVISPSVSLNDIAVSTSETGKATWTAADLYTDTALTTAAPNPFDKSTMDYYLQVKPGTDLKIDLTGTLPLDTATIKVNNGTALTAADVDTTTSGVTSFVVDSAKLDNTGDASNANGFKNTITVEWTVGGTATTYTIHVRQLVEAGITLNYGNSPYGEIERMGTKATGAWDSDYIATAKEKFDKNNKFVKDYVPDGYGTTTKYTLNAWFGKSSGVSDADKADSTKNLDRNPYALFVYNKQTFKDPGFTAVDSLGNTLDSSKVTRKIETLYTLTATAVKNWPDDKVVTHTDVAVTENASGVIDVISTGNATNKYVRPGVYAITYSFEDEATGKTISIKRPLVVMLAAGDANADKSVNGNDATRINNIVKGSMDPYTGYKESDLWIYKFRVLDVNSDGSVNGSDATRINNIVKGTTTAPTWYINMD